MTIHEICCETGRDQNSATRAAGRYCNARSSYVTAKARMPPERRINAGILCLPCHEADRVPLWVHMWCGAPPFGWRADAGRNAQSLVRITVCGCQCQNGSRSSEHARKGYLSRSCARVVRDDIGNPSNEGRSWYISIASEAGVHAAPLTAAGSCG